MENMMNLKFSMIALVLLATPALAGDDSPSLTGDEFVLPSGNIACILQEVSLEGDDGPSQRLYCVRNKPKTIAVMLNHNGVESFPTDGDQPFSAGAPVLNYDEGWENGDFQCAATTKGLLCSFKGKLMFRLAKAGLKKF
jgi:hypothetical protein